MKQPFISYDTYFEMTDSVQEWKLSANNISVPKFTIERIINGDMIYSNLLFLVWIIENGIIDDENIIRKINKKIVESYHFAEDGEEASPNEETGKIKISYEEYAILENLSKHIEFKDWNPAEEDLSKNFYPYIRYGIGFFTLLLIKFKDCSKKEWYRWVKNAINENCEIIQNPNVISIDTETFEKIKSRVDTIKIDEDDYWPTPDDIEKYMIPNLRKSIPFLVYLLKDGRKTNTAGDIESKSILQNIFDKNISVIQKGGVIWQ